MLSRRLIVPSIVSRRYFTLETGLAITMIGSLIYRYKVVQRVLDTKKMQPRDYTFELKAVTEDRIQFILPMTFTISPKDEPEALVETTTNQLTTMVLGLLEGEIRTQCYMLRAQDLLNYRQIFFETIVQYIQEELDKLGLRITDAKIKEFKELNDYSHNRNQEEENKPIKKWRDNYLAAVPAIKRKTIVWKISRKRLHDSYEMLKRQKSQPKISVWSTSVGTIKSETTPFEWLKDKDE
jgi:hypothetical protein